MGTKAEPAAAPVDDGVIELAGGRYMRDAKGALMPLEGVRAADKLMDEVVRELVAEARVLRDLLAAYRAKALDRIESVQALIAQEYGVTRGGAKGNVRMTAYDGTLSVEVKAADILTFGPELQAAKGLVDACLIQWGATSSPQLRAVVADAFAVDKAGKLNVSRLHMLLRIEVEDDQWREAMRALRDSIRVIGSKRYVLIEERDAPDGEWSTLSLNIAKL